MGAALALVLVARSSFVVAAPGRGLGAAAPAAPAPGSVAAAPAPGSVAVAPAAPAPGSAAAATVPDSSLVVFVGAGLAVSHARDIDDNMWGPAVTVEIGGRSGDTTLGAHLGVSHGSGKSSFYYQQGGDSHEGTFTAIELGLSGRINGERFWGGGWAGIQLLEGEACDWFADDVSRRDETTCEKWVMGNDAELAAGVTFGFDVLVSGRHRGALFVTATSALGGESFRGIWSGVAYRTW